MFFCQISIILSITQKYYKEDFTPERIGYPVGRILNIIYGKKRYYALSLKAVRSMNESNAILTFLVQAFIHKTKFLTVINRYDMLSCIYSKFSMQIAEL